MACISQSPAGGAVAVRDVVGNNIARFVTTAGRNVTGNVVFKPSRTRTGNATVASETISGGDGNLELSAKGSGRVTTTADVTVSAVTSVSDTTQSTTSANGALIVAGGVGIAKNVTIAGETTAAGLSFDGVNTIATFTEPAGYSGGPGNLVNLVNMTGSANLATRYHIQIGNVIYVAWTSPFTGYSVSSVGEIAFEFYISHPRASSKAVIYSSCRGYQNSGTKRIWIIATDDVVDLNYVKFKGYAESTGTTSIGGVFAYITS